MEVAFASPDLNTSATDLHKIYGQELLSWFAHQPESKIVRDDFLFSGKNICRIFANLCSDKSLGGFGRSQDEFLAAIKACAEALERKVYQQHGSRKDLLDLKLMQNRDKLSIEVNSTPFSINSSFYNSNGWAVGFTGESSLDRAKSEALERHLLLQTFLKDGWDGFYEISRIVIDEVEFISLVSKYSLAGYSAGLGIARTKKFKGVSFGYLCDKSEVIKISPKWEQAFYESYDYIRVRSMLKDFKPEQDSISQELNFYLENNFEQIFSTNEESLNLGESFTANCAVIDLKEAFNLSFPFFAGVVHGGDLLPLFFKKTLTVEGENYLQKKFRAMGLSSVIPERHPIL